MAELRTSFVQHVRPLLDACDTIREFVGEGKEINLNIPTIAVVGDQSSGKSSVLEALSGISLPRGQNIVTRCPLILRMVDAPSKDSSVARLRTSLGTEDILDMSTIGTKIQEVTNLLAGRDFGISADPIHLTVYKSGLPDLTLVDLPGITRNPVGRQPSNIGELIRSLLGSYIRNPNCVILCVLPATIDFVTSEAIAMARAVDPTGSRTLGVVTKCDLAERGLAAKLSGKQKDTISLKLGFVAVRCRTQDEIDKRMTHEESRERERQLFETVRA
eukprot:c19478_g1_i4.p1 GENE.c19478_g1_i4~~c19478_g1_i4.p1  ORF type:complete len:284 (-),score=39.65 c19478_g1_i4:1630-2451(-)